MTKAEAIRMFGSKKALADAMGVHRSLISKLPDELPTKYSDRVTGAAIRLGHVIPRPVAGGRQLERDPAEDGHSGTVGAPRTPSGSMS